MIGVYIERLITIIEKSERHPVVASEPGWGLALPSRQYSSPYAINLGVFVEGALDVSNPVLRHPHVIICKSYDLGPRLADPRIARIRHPLLRLEYVAQIRVASP